MKKGLKITLITISSVLVFFMIVCSIYYFWPWNKEFFRNADEEFAIPGLDTTFVPQGMTRIDAGGDIVISGYMSDGSPSRFYVLDGETKEVKKYFTLNIDGKKYTGHAGGVASYGNYLWTCSSEDDNGYVFQFLLSDLNNVTSGYEIDVREYYHTYNTADYLFVNNNILWVGEFYKAKKFETKESHWIKTRSGETNKAVAFGFQLDQNYGIRSEIPVKALSTGDLCQGIAITSDGNIVVSASFSLSDSKILYYSNVFSEDRHSTINVGTYKNVPLWFLDGKSLISTKNAPAMSEEIYVHNNRVYVLFESACKKYRMFNRKRIKSVYSLPITYFEN